MSRPFRLRRSELSTPGTGWLNRKPCISSQFCARRNMR